MNLKHLTDKQLLLDTKELSREDKKLTLKMLHYIREVDVRKLYSEIGYASLFRYVVQELGYSEGSAGRRINSARLLKEIPEIEKKIISGDLTLSNISMAADKFKSESITDTEFKKDILNTIENSSTRTCEKTLAEIITPSSLPIVSPPAITHTLVMDDKSYQSLQSVRGLLAHKRLSKDEIWNEIFRIAIAHLEFIKFKTNSNKTSTSRDSRYIPVDLKKSVYERDQKRCRKCGSRFALEFDHIKPFALGGKTEFANLRLLCRNCNQRSRVTAFQGMY
jgi:hypothetical protein